MNVWLRVWWHHARPPRIRPNLSPHQVTDLILLTRTSASDDRRKVFFDLNKNTRWSWMNRNSKLESHKRFPRDFQDFFHIFWSGNDNKHVKNMKLTFCSLGSALGLLRVEEGCSSLNATWPSLGCAGLWTTPDRSSMPLHGCWLSSSWQTPCLLLLFFLFSFFCSCLLLEASPAWTSCSRSPHSEDSNSSLPFW